MSPPLLQPQSASPDVQLIAMFLSHLLSSFCHHFTVFSTRTLKCPEIQKLGLQSTKQSEIFLSYDDDNDNDNDNDNDIDNDNDNDNDNDHHQRGTPAGSTAQHSTAAASSSQQQPSSSPAAASGAALRWGPRPRTSGALGAWAAPAPATGVCGDE